MSLGPGISNEETASDLKKIVPQLVDRLQTFESFRSVIPQVFYNHSRNSNRSITHIELKDQFTHKAIRTASPYSSDDLIPPLAVPKIAAALSRIALKETKSVATTADLLRVLDDYLHTVDQLRSSQSHRSSTASLIRSQVDHAQSLFTETMLRLAPGANAADVDAYFQLRYQRYASYKPPSQRAWLPTGELGKKLASLDLERLGLPKEIDFVSAVILATNAKMNILNFMEQLPNFKISGPWGRDVFTLSDSEMEAYVRGLQTLEGTASAKSNELESKLLSNYVRLDPSAMPTWNGSYLQDRESFFSRSLSVALRDNQSSRAIDAKTWAKRVARQWHSSIESCLKYNSVTSAFGKEMDKMRFAEAAEFALALNEALIEGAKRRAVAAEKLGETELRNSLDEYASRLEQFGSGSVFDFPNLVTRFQILKDPASVDAAYLAKLYSLASRTGQPSHEMNDVFEYLWSKKDTNPAVARELLNPEIISVLSYDVQKRDVALFQLRHKLGWDSYKKKSDSGELEPPKVHEVRDVIRQAQALIQEQFPKPGAIKSQVIDRIEKDFASSLAENRFIGSDRITSKNWHESALVLAVDIPSSFSSKLRSDYDRMDMVKYMIGVNPTIPAAVEEQFAQFGKSSKTWEERARRDFGAFTSLFRSSDPAARTYVLQNLLGKGDSLFEDPQMMKQVHDLVLGAHKTDRVYRKLFVAYLDSIPANEKKVLLAYVLSSFLDNPDKKSGASVKSVLEAMGPFGIKVGQYLRSSGLVSPSLHRELDDFYDRALEPSRYRSYQDLEKALGTDLPGIEGVRELVGSGSLNYGMLVEYRDKKGVKRRSVIRIQREEAGGQIQNEDKNWTEAIAKLYQDDDEDIRALAQVLEESRLTAMQTLGDQGKEMDLGYERAQYGNARTAYENEKVNPSTGLKIEVAAPDLELQAKVLAEMGKKVSAYEYVPNMRFQDLDSGMKSKVATQIVEAELRALFQKGIFDPDGHPGNWLIDTESGRLVRIDYAQMTQIDPARLLRFREVISSLFLPGRVKEKAALISNNLPVLFEIKGNTKGMETMLAKILNDPKLPPFSNPHLRLMYIRQELEKALQKGQPSASVRLSQEARAVLGSVSRMLSYKDHISTDTFERLLKEHVGVQFSKLDYLRLLGTRDGRELVAQKVLTTVGDRSSEIAARCLNYLKQFGRKQ